MDDGHLERAGATMVGDSGTVLDGFVVIAHLLFGRVTPARHNELDMKDFAEYWSSA
jgi:hypothetical protein